MAYEAHKRSYLDTEAECTQQGVTFIPMVAESSGGWGPDALKTLRQLAKTSSSRARTDEDTTMGHLLQSLCVTIRSAKARAVLRRAGNQPDAAATAIEAAEAALLAATVGA